MQGEDLERIGSIITTEATASGAATEATPSGAALPAAELAAPVAPAAAAAAPVPSDTFATAALADPVALTRRSLLAAYAAILDQIRELAPGERSDRVAQLAEAAAALVGGEFAQRLVFGTSGD